MYTGFYKSTGHIFLQEDTLLGLQATGMGIPVYTLKLRVVVLGILTGVIRGLHAETPGDYQEHTKWSWGMPGTSPVMVSSHQSRLLSGYLGKGETALGHLGTWYGGTRARQVASS